MQCNLSFFSNTEKAGVKSPLSLLTAEHRAQKNYRKHGHYYKPSRFKNLEFM